MQVTVSPDGGAIHVSPPIPGRRYDACLFGNSGLAEFMKKTGRTSGRTEITHLALFADSNYVELDEAHYELIVCKKKHQEESYLRKTERQVQNCIPIEF